MITYTDVHDGWIDMHYSNGVYMGGIYQEVDGFFYWQPTNTDGFLSAHVLLEIGNKLKELNKEWEETFDNSDI
jgi:hypothetical protein